MEAFQREIGSGDRVLKALPMFAKMAKSITDDVDFRALITEAKLQ